jgi:cytochrome oxidase Cu insertion factor (SCO1/SenC/PrrC family)
MLRQLGVTVSFMIRSIPALLLAVPALLTSTNATAVPGEGATAPNWTLQGSDGNQYSLTDFRGKHVVIAFFPKAFTGG